MNEKSGLILKHFLLKKHFSHLQLISANALSTVFLSSHSLTAYIYQSALSDILIANSQIRQLANSASVHLSLLWPAQPRTVKRSHIEGFAQHLVPVFLKAQSSPAVFRCILGLWRIPLVLSFIKGHSLERWHGRILCTYSTWVDLLYLSYATCGVFIPFQNKISHGWKLILEIKKRRLWCWLQSFEKVAKKFTSRILGPKTFAHS